MNKYMRCSKTGTIDTIISQANINFYSHDVDLQGPLVVHLQFVDLRNKVLLTWQLWKKSSTLLKLEYNQHFPPSLKKKTLTPMSFVHVVVAIQISWNQLKRSRPNTSRHAQEAPVWVWKWQGIAAKKPKKPKRKCKPKVHVVKAKHYKRAISKPCTFCKHKVPSQKELNDHFRVDHYNLKILCSKRKCSTQLVKETLNYNVCS